MLRLSIILLCCFPFMVNETFGKDAIEEEMEDVYQLLVEKKIITVDNRCDGEIKTVPWWIGKVVFHRAKCASRYFQSIIELFESAGPTFPLGRTDSESPPPLTPDEEFVKWYNKELPWSGRLEELKCNLDEMSNEKLKTEVDKRKKVLATIFGELENKTLCYYYKQAETQVEKARKKTFLQRYREWRINHGENAFSIKNPPSEKVLRFLEKDSNPKAVETAKELSQWMKRYCSQRKFTEDEINKCPWYVVGCFFEYFNLQTHGIDKDDSQFIPGSRDELFDFSSLENGNYVSKVPESIKKWLTKFGYEKLQTENLDELLDLLRKQLEAVQPCHRYMRNQYPQGTEARSFMNLLIGETEETEITREE